MNSDLERRILHLTVHRTEAAMYTSLALVLALRGGLRRLGFQQCIVLMSLTDTEHSNEHDMTQTLTR